MRKVLSIAIIILIAASCDPVDEKEAVKSQIREYKDEVVRLNIKIKELEQELASLGETGEQFISPVTIDRLQERPFNHYFQVSGNVDAVEKAFISPEINGQVKEILVEEGDHVKKGQLLARLNTSITENTIQEIKTQQEMANTLYEKQKQLWDKNIGSEVQYLQAKNNKEAMESKLLTLQAQLDMAYVKSPINGIVDAIFIEEGELAMPGFQLMQVINLNKLKISSNVSEKYLPVINKGDVVELTFPTFPSIEMKVAVERTGNVVNLGNRTFPVELRIDNIDGQLKPNILALITFLDFNENNALIIPSIVIKEDIQGEYVYIVKEVDGKAIAKKVYITSGMSYNDETMILSGLNPGDQVIIEGYSLVTAGTEVKII
ncbi:MAG: efflux RND transporter periplasmic adaptor subunit [Bacteroidales bacterium]|nr:efflux RND transporter periplasmic adaptor subunit [Bacteroidales bacterium]